MGHQVINLIRRCTKPECKWISKINMLISSLFHPSMSRPTRITCNSATLIDNIHIFNRIEDNFTSGLLVTNLSDHLRLYFKLQLL